MVPNPLGLVNALEKYTAAGPDPYRLTSTGPTLQSIGVMDGVRIGGDYGEGRPLD